MPNHVEQDIVITGSSVVLQEFMAFAVEGEHLLSANKFIPYPEKFRLLDERGKEEQENGNFFFRDGFNSGGYEWCRDNWGTKWGIYGSSLVSQKLTGKTGKVKYTCQSAWSPALPVVFAMSQKFPSLKFNMKYYERGAQYKGNYIVQGGLVLLDDTSKYRGKRGG